MKMLHFTKNEMATLVLSLLALAVSYYALQESKESRLPARRSQLRIETLEMLNNTSTALARFNCYASFQSVIDQSQFEAPLRQVREADAQLRRMIVSLNHWGDDGLDIFETNLNESQGVSEGKLNEAIIAFRAHLADEMLAKADKACATGGT